MADRLYKCSFENGISLLVQAKSKRFAIMLFRSYHHATDTRSVVKCERVDNI